MKPYARNYTKATRGRVRKTLRRCRECGEERVTASKTHMLNASGVSTYCGTFRIVRESWSPGGSNPPRSDN